jgi:hypothetical protein
MLLGTLSLERELFDDYVLIEFKYNEPVVRRNQIRMTSDSWQAGYRASSHCDSALLILVDTHTKKGVRDYILEESFDGPPWVRKSLLAPSLVETAGIVALPDSSTSLNLLCFDYRTSIRRHYRWDWIIDVSRPPKPWHFRCKLQTSLYLFS